MLKEVIVSGLLGGVVLIVWGFVVNGMGHESAGGQALVQLVALLLAPMIGAWMLSATSRRTISSYPRKVLFFAAIGLLFAAFSDLMNSGIDGYSLNDALILAVHDIIVWTLVGLVVAWRIKPEPGVVTHS